MSFRVELSLWFIVMLGIAVLGAGAVSCKESRSAPPPITDGKCLVDQFIGSAAKKQTCDYVGYRWVCALGDDGVNVCSRGAEVSG